MVLKRLVRCIAAVAGMAAITAAFLPIRNLIQGKPGTVAFMDLIVILLLAQRWGIESALAASVTAMLTWNFLFLPPYFRFLSSG